MVKVISKFLSRDFVCMNHNKLSSFTNTYICHVILCEFCVLICRNFCFFRVDLPHSNIYTHICKTTPTTKIIQYSVKQSIYNFPFNILPFFKVL